MTRGAREPKRTPAARCRRGMLCVLTLCGALAGPVAGQLKVERGPDGVLVISNSGERPAEQGRVTTASTPSRAPSRAPGSARTRRPPPPHLERWISEAAAVQGLDPDLVHAVIRTESAYDEDALSHRGAMGLMQLMPATAADLGVRNPWDARENLRGGTRYLRQMLDRFSGSLELALAAYNAGPSAVERHGGVPPYRETLRYVDRVLGHYGRAGARGAGPAVVRPLAPDYRSFRVERDAQGHLVLVTQ